MAKQHREYLEERLKNDEAARAYLDSCLNEAIDAQDPGIFLLAVRDVVRARKMMSEIADQTQLNRQNLYRALDESGNPTLSTLFSVMSVLGFQLAVKRLNKKTG